MTALVGCVLSYALLVPGAPPATDAPAQGELCAVTMGDDMFLDLDVSGGGEAAVGACPVGAEATLHRSGPAGTATTTYSNPIEVNCPAPTGAGNGGAATLANQGEKSDWFHGCDARAFDFRYRVSRFPDSERQSGALGPQRERRAARSLTLATGLPPKGGTLLSLSSPPLALYAVVGLVPPVATALGLQDQRPAPTRVLEPLERPPRA